MNKKLNRIMAVILAMSLLILTACSGTEDKDLNTGQTSSGEKAMGRFMEDAFSMPENMALVYDMVKMADGKLRVVGSISEMDAPMIFDSTDGGQTWVENPQKVSCFSPDNYVLALKLDPNGRMFVQYFKMDDLGKEAGGSETHYCYVDENGTEKEVELKLPEVNMEGGAEVNNSQSGQGGEGIKYKNSLNKLLFSENGGLYGVDANQSVLKINPETGEIQNSYDNPGTFVEGIGATAKYLFVCTSNGVEMIDLESGESQGNQDILNEYFVQDSNGLSVSGLGEKIVFTSGKDDREVYFCNNKGLYRFVVGGNVVEQVINGELNSISSPGVYFKSLIAMEDHSFLLSCEDNGSIKLLKYTYKDDVPAMPDTELKVYALEDSTSLRQIISAFQKSHPDVFVSLEIGMTGDDAMTTADALRTLNTNIMAGKGPDILLLDGMPIENYIEKGLLADLSDIVEDVSGTEGLFENIIQTYEEDGKICAVPTKFAIPLMLGKSDNVDKITDLKTMADQFEAIRQANPEIASITGKNDVESFIEMIYPSSSPSLMKADGTLDEAKLKEFLTELKRMRDADIPGGSPGDVPNASIYVFATGGEISLPTIDSMGFANNQVLFGLGGLQSLDSLSSVYSAANYVEGASYGLQPGLSKNVYCPSMTMGVNTKSVQQDVAKEFIKNMLTSQTQEIGANGGIPVNKAAFSKLQENPYSDSAESGVSVGITDVSGMSFTLEISWPPQEDFEKLEGWINSLDTPSVADKTIKEAIMEEAANCLNGTSTVDVCAGKIMQKVNLYLSE